MEQDKIHKLAEDLWCDFADESDGRQTTMNYESFIKVIHQLINKFYKIEDIKIFTKPMTDKERSASIGLPLKMPVRYHLVDCLKDLKFGRPADNQKQIQKWIDKLNENLDNGVPFT